METHIINFFKYAALFRLLSVSAFMFVAFLPLYFFL